MADLPGFVTDKVADGFDRMARYSLVPPRITSRRFVSVSDNLHFNSSQVSCGMWTSLTGK